MSPVNPADRPSWRPEPPRLPDWFTRRFPVPPGRPPKIRTPRYRPSASAPPFTAVVKADAGARAAGERALHRTFLLLDVLAQDADRSAA